MTNRAFRGEKLIVLWFMIIGSAFSQNHRGDQIFFRGPVNYGNRAWNGAAIPSYSMSSDAMEIQAALEFNDIQSFDDFLSKVEGLPDSERIGNVSIGTRFGEERSNVVIPKPAACIPEEQTVCLRNSSKILYYPGCTRVMRCGGCCSNDKLSCQPNTTVTKNFQVYATKRISGKLKFIGKEIVQVEEHTACTCGCKVKSEHCNERQTYKPMECRCACSTHDEEAKCLESSQIKEWNSKTCSCKCRGRTECTSGSYYDHSTCSCKTVTTASRRRYSTGEQDSDSPSYSIYGSDDSDSGNSQQRPIIYTISSDDPRRKHKEDPE